MCVSGEEIKEECESRRMSGVMNRRKHLGRALNRH